MRALIYFTFFIQLFSCKTSSHNYLLPYIDVLTETEKFVDSLKKNNVDTILVYQKKYCFHRNCYVLWQKNDSINLRNISRYNISKIKYNSVCDYSRNTKVFSFYLKNKDEIDNSILENNIVIKGKDTIRYYISHYPYSEIKIYINNFQKTYHLPDGIYSDLDNNAFHYARLIESVIFNITKDSYWIEAEKKDKYYPKGFNRSKLK